MPEALKSARFIDGVCQRYSVLPSQLDHEDLSFVRMLALLGDAGDFGEPNVQQSPAEPDSPLADLMESI
jgi:hypothetical protein|tara:strand:+ start:241 stop:447 length:207 start_codon:yes stop_codon:yes gene_type:complete